MNINIKKARTQIAEIIGRNLSLMNKNNRICEDVADSIILYIIEEVGEEK